MQISRRRAITLLSAVGAVASDSLPSWAAAAPNRLFFSASANARGHNSLSGFFSDGRNALNVPLPGRGHGIAVDPQRKRAVVLARRPGVFGIAVDLRRGLAQTRFYAPKDTHFYGHAVFSTGGRRLYTTENAFSAGHGVIGVWDTRDGFKRIGALTCHGIGPHEVILSSDGETLIVGNGGIQTHPDTGREKLNIDRMEPSLAFIDVRSGALKKEASFDKLRYQKLSLRHLAVNGRGTVCVGMQDQLRDGQMMPLVAFNRQDSAKLVFGIAPAPVLRRMRGYTGSVAMDVSGDVAAVSAPRGNLVTFWDVEGASYLSHLTYEDCSGVATSGPGKFILTSGAGGAIEYAPRSGVRTPLPAPFVKGRRWDNHLHAVEI